jgi:hypothetical protein
MNGLEMANQKEKPQPESWAFVFILLSKEFERGHFKKK